MIFTITVQNPPLSNAGIDLIYCEGISGNSIGTTPVSGNTYSWTPITELSDPFISNPTLSNLSDGIYLYTVTTTDALGCISTDEVSVTVMVTPNADFDVNPTNVTIENPSVTTDNNSTDALTYSWNFGDGFTSSLFNPDHTFPESPATFPITLVVQNGVCIDSITKYVVVAEELILYVPNTFTPDGDEFNNAFVPILNTAYDYQNYSFNIFDRWGELIFESHNPLVGWDGTYLGKLCKEGQYIWKIEVKEKNEDDHFLYHDHVNLLH